MDCSVLADGCHEAGCDESLDRCVQGVDLCASQGCGQGAVPRGGSAWILAWFLLAVAMLIARTRR
jgi:hypothetical protein